MHSNKSAKKRIDNNNIRKMKNILNYLIGVIFIGLLIFPVNIVYSGNKDRSGQAGASELLINPWARSSGWGGVNTASVRGLESMYNNIAGLAFTERSEIIFSNTQWLKGSDINIMSFGFAQRIGESGVLGLSIMSMSFGDIEVTTYDHPDPSEGSIGTFSPSMMNINIGYAKTFSNSIYGGINIKIISENISDVSAQGIAIDAGIQYVTGATENIKFGIALKNIGPTMSFSGDGMSFRGIIPAHNNDNDQFTVEQRSAEFELPALLNIGAAYDFNINENHKLTLAGNFTSNSFTKDQFIFGAEYRLKTYLMLRAAYTYEEGITNSADRTTVFTGPSGGITVQVPLNKEKGTNFSVDYSYRATNPFSGTHSIGARISL